MNYLQQAMEEYGTENLGHLVEEIDQEIFGEKAEKSTSTPWEGIKGFFSWLWEGIVSIGKGIFGGILSFILPKPKPKIKMVRVVGNLAVKKEGRFWIYIIGSTKATACVGNLPSFLQRGDLVQLRGYFRQVRDKLGRFGRKVFVGKEIRPLYLAK